MNLMIDPHHIWNVIYNARSPQSFKCIPNVTTFFKGIFGLSQRSIYPKIHSFWRGKKKKHIRFRAEHFSQELFYNPPTLQKFKNRLHFRFRSCWCLHKNPSWECMIFVEKTHTLPENKHDNGRTTIWRCVIVHCYVSFLGGNHSKKRLANSTFTRRICYLPEFLNSLLLLSNTARAMKKFPQ